MFLKKTTKILLTFSRQSLLCVSVIKITKTLFFERNLEMGFDEMEPVFGRLNAEWSAPHKTPLKPFLFHVHGLSTDPSTLCVCATDFHSNTWHALKSAQELEDMVCPCYSLLFDLLSSTLNFLTFSCKSLTISFQF